ncbi:LysR family transcriptional regulator [Acidisoma cellulosilytica]|uniref:LysR family transcriptional regulator n=1 Tax=Acidisoma cellulosilyticum TaxID=2802395 RepID=A0A964E229_9PROT|nr:LysR family transcriptional regulator [Acidisoma cellulosilyticum]MCB8878971.1 LysR family transcriptional regulator [Acidisoma cellulosilyticum]
MNRAGLDDLAAFASIARTLSFTRAAAELRLSTSALSHKIKTMEARLGIRLLQRNSRSVALTEAGAQLLQTLAPALEEIDGALDRLGQARDAVAGTVRITATRHGYETVIRPVLPAFLASHPKAGVEVVIDYQRRDIIAERLDAGIRIGEKLEQDMIAISVSAPLRMAVLASPAYLAEHGLPQVPQDLMQHACINARMAAAGQPMDWDFERDGREIAIKVSGPLTFNDPLVMLDAAMAGLGIAYVIEGSALPHIAAGRLVRVLEDWSAPFPGYFLYYPSRRQMPAVLAALVAMLRRRRDQT